jgi:hypothetical protein
MMNRRIFAITALAFATLFFNACSSENDEGGSVILNKALYQEQIEASDNGYCPLLPFPYDPRACRGEATEQPDGSIECQGLSLTECQVHGINCERFSEAERDSLQKAYDAMLKKEEEEAKLDAERQIEVQRIRRDSTREATVAFSKSQTLIQLSPVFVEVMLNLVQLKDSKKNDTLYIDAVPDKNGSYGRMGGMSSCPISLDIALNHVDENISVIVFEREQVFQVKR